MTEPPKHKARRLALRTVGGHFILGRFMCKLKKALTYDEQVDRLEQFHSLTVNDRNRAIEILKSVNYYRLSGYGIGLKEPKDKEKYKKGISLDFLYSLYLFDSNLRNILIHTIEYIEIQFRSRIAYFLANKYGAEGYMDLVNFTDKRLKDGSSVHSNIINNLKEEFERQKNSPFVKHHMNQYNGHFPIWVSVELFTFGNQASLFSIMKEEDKKAIAKLYKTSHSFLISWILSLVETRNICAHYGRLYNALLKQAPALLAKHKIYRQRLNKLFPVILVIKYVLYNKPDIWNEFYRKLSDLITSNLSIINLSFMGFPTNWDEILTA